MVGGNKQKRNNELQMMILIGQYPLSIRGNKLLLQTKVVPRAIRPLWMFCSFYFRGGDLYG